ncbi:MAG: NADP-dependent malic enzyme [Erysipelotrichaceae bacterium]|nr:NADP-dependent malic enzyme [Erysipelotrichaceae bacterium]MDD3923745.1 NADP-dependent malic enzyme [Erysipelotrichaceae bacterium]MDD4642333.1 NADP-dependent malic enzyme [Erysipelotrichaceae bacterium]
MNSEALKKHYQWKGKIKIESLVKIKDAHDLALAYTPGVADACLAIQDDVSKAYALTRKWNTVAVITDGTAVLGLGDIGPEASMPVMEGKCLLFKEFADIDAIPICLNTKDTDELVKTIYYMSKSFGGINLEDIAAPRCFEIEERLTKICDIPVFHDDQHGTAIVVCAALKNALKLVNKDIDKIKIVINGVGAAGSAIAEMLFNINAKDIIFVDRQGILNLADQTLNSKQRMLVTKSRNKHLVGKLNDAISNADVFIGVSTKDVLNMDMIISMNDKPIIFAMANPIPEIMPDKAKSANAFIIGTGRSDYANQINNLLVFPGIFKGALMSRAKLINLDMKIAAIDALADIIDKDDLTTDKIIPSVFNKLVVERISRAVAKAAIASKVSRI